MIDRDHIRSGILCRYCRRLVSRVGIVAPGGRVILVIRCKHCDRYTERSDR